MVEGPKVALKKERLSSLVGRCVKAIRILKRGSTNDFVVQTLPEQENNEKAQLASVKFVGKELFFIFNLNFQIKYHFGMNGSERVIDEVGNITDIHTFAQSLMPKYSRKQLTAIVEFTGKTAFFYDTTVTVSRMDNAALSESISQRSSYDVMSSTFSPDNVFPKITQDERVIHTVLLDQSILPGVGNIIKCEALFRAKLHPDIVAKSVPAQQVKSLIQHVHDFSWEWYKATKAFKSVKKEIYEYTQCNQCLDRIVLVRSGIYQRITYYCPTCQPLPTTQTIFVSTSSSSFSRLDAAEDSTKAVQSLQHPPLQPWKCEFCNRVNNFDALECEICEEPCPRPAVNTTLTADRSDTEHSVPCHNESIIGSIHHPTAVKHPPCCIHTIRPIRCKCSLPAMLQRVRKSGPNVNRLFWVCGKEIATTRNNQSKHSKKPISSCGFVGWADVHFPSCSQHSGMKTILRRVLKEGKNNGRYFYTCTGAEQCSFFQWDDELPLLPMLLDSNASQSLGVLHIPL